MPSLQDIEKEILAAFQFQETPERAAATGRILFQTAVMDQLAGSRKPVLIANACLAARSLEPADRNRALEGILTTSALASLAVSRNHSALGAVARSVSLSTNAEFMGWVIGQILHRKSGLDRVQEQVALGNLLTPTALNTLASSGDAMAIAKAVIALSFCPLPDRHEDWKHLMTPQAMATLAMSPIADFLTHMASDMGESGGAALLERLRQRARTLHAQPRNQVLQRLSRHEVAHRPQVLPALHPQGRHVAAAPPTPPTWQDVANRPAGQGAPSREARPGRPGRGGPGPR